MRQAVTILLAAAALSGTCAYPAYAGYDEFQVPPGLEQTPIPRRLNSSPRFSQNITQADIDRIEHYRQEIQKLYAAGNYVDAEPVYRSYVSAIERVAPNDSRLAVALQNYADLLRKLHKDNEAASVEVRAQAIMAHSDQQTMPYALKEWKLGMTLDEFTRMPPPGEAGKVKGVCSCDPGQEVEILNDEDKATKTIQCGYWLTQGKNVIASPYKMTIANVECQPDFRFVEQEANTGYKLFEISVSFFSSNFDAMKQALIAKYGTPTKTTIDKVHTEMGNIFLLTNLIWDNGVSRIKLTNADGNNMGRAKLRYIHRQLFLVYATRINALRNDPNKRAAEDL